MTQTHTKQTVYNYGATVPLTVTETISSEETVIIERSVAASTTDLLIGLAFTRSLLKSFFVKVDGALTLEVNSGSSPTVTFSPTAILPIEWSTNSPTPVNTFFPSADVTGIYVTNASSTTAVALTIVALLDSTP